MHILSLLFNLVDSFHLRFMIYKRNNSFGVMLIISQYIRPIAYDTRQACSDFFKNLEI